jgi:hypothetical protein
MKKIYTLVALAFTAYPLLAQITSADMPQVGDTQFYTACDTAGITEGPSGSGVTWDFTNVTPSGSSFTINYNAPAGHPQAANYPAANIVEAYTNQQYRFHAATVDSVVLQGEKSVANTPVIYSVKPTLYIFPMALGYLQTDSMYGSYPDGFFSSVNRAGTYTVEVDGSGTLITPTGTFNNVLRVKTTGSFTDTSLAGASVATAIGLTHRYEWFTPGTRTAQMYMTQTILVVNGGNPQIGRDVWYASSGVGIENPLSSLDMHIAPSYADDRATLSYTLQDAGDVHVDVLSAVGAKVAEIHPGAQSSGTHSLELKLESLAPGMYMVRVSAGEESQLQKFVVR